MRGLWGQNQILLDSPRQPENNKIKFIYLDKIVPMLTETPTLCFPAVWSSPSTSAWRYEENFWVASSVPSTQYYSISGFFFLLLIFFISYYTYEKRRSYRSSRSIRGHESIPPLFLTTTPFFLWSSSDTVPTSFSKTCTRPITITAGTIMVLKSAKTSVEVGDFGSL